MALDGTRMQALALVALLLLAPGGGPERPPGTGATGAALPSIARVAERPSRIAATDVALVGIATLTDRPSRAAATDAALTGIASVTDGDTMRIGEARIRIFGIDAPESRQRCGAWDCGAAATARLKQLVRLRPVRCAPRERDRYGRLVSTCTAGGVDLGARLVAEGLARAYTRYGDDYAATEARAKTERLGLWRAPSQAPWDYRRAAADAPAAPVHARPAAPDPACRIKGNIAMSGARLYHLPGSPSYASTRIDPRRGESWFCTEEQAHAAGFRPPRGR